MLGRALCSSETFKDSRNMWNKNINLIHHFVKLGDHKLLPNFANNTFTRSCGIGSLITVSANGKIYPCPILNQPSLGSVIDRNGKLTMQSVKKYIEKTNVDNIETCKKCEIKYFCGGKCRITNMNQTGSYIKTNCSEYYKGIQLNKLVRIYKSFLLSFGLYNLIKELYG